MKATEIISVKIIGHVRNSIEEKVSRERSFGLASEIVLKEKYAKGLLNIEKFSHLEIMFWFDRVPVEKRKTLSVGYGKKSCKKVGVFATHVRFRPNLIGTSRVKLIYRRKNILMVWGLEAFNGSPVLDIKPYTEHVAERVGSDFRCAPWAFEHPVIFE